jgi:hypothetical protein
MKKLLFFLLLIPSFSFAGTSYYVSTSGSDGADGSFATPWRNVFYCSTRTVAGDTCFVRTGTYDMKLSGETGGGLVLGTGHTAFGTDYGAGAITIKPYNNEVVSFTNTFFGSDYIMSSSGSNLYWIIDGIIFDGAGQTRTGGSANGLISGGGSYLRIQNCIIKNGVSSGLEPIGDHWDLLNDEVYNNGTQAGAVQYHGIYWSGTNLLIDGGSYHDNYGYGVHIFNSGHIDVSTNTVRNARIYNNGIDVINGGGGMILSCGYLNTGYNNFIYGNTNGPALQIDFQSVGSSAYNNTIYNNTGYAIQVGHVAGSGTDNTIIKNNIIYANGSDIYDNGTNTDNTNNFIGNPSFVSTTTFILASTSTAIGYGLNISSRGITGLATDFYGNPRPPDGGANWDAGGYSSYAPSRGGTFKGGVKFH